MFELTTSLDLDDAFADLERELSEVARGLSVFMWDTVLKQTPQWAGRMAASWTYSLGSPVFVDRSKTMDENATGHPTLHQTAFSPVTGEEGFDGRKKGDPEAIGIANFASLGADTAFRLGMDIWFANGVDHGEGAYSGEIESGGVRLRRVNLPGTPVRTSIDLVQARYGGGVEAIDASYLKNLRIGG